MIKIGKMLPSLKTGRTYELRYIRDRRDRTRFIVIVHLAFPKRQIIYHINSNLECAFTRTQEARKHKGGTDPANWISLTPSSSDFEEPIFANLKSHMAHCQWTRNSIALRPSSIQLTVATLSKVSLLSSRISYLIGDMYPWCTPDILAPPSSRIDRRRQRLIHTSHTTIERNGSNRIL